MAAATFDLAKGRVGLLRDGTSEVQTSTPPGPPIRCDGWNVGAPMLTRDAPHNGEMHPDGGEHRPL